MVSKCKAQKKIVYLMIMAVLFLEFSFWLTSEMNTKLRYFLILGISGMALIIRKKFSISKQLLWVFTIIITIQCISSIIMGTYPGVTTGLYVTTISAFLFIIAIDYKEFSTAFRYFMIIECICSLITFFAYLIMPQAFDIFPTITTWRQGRIFFKNVYFSVLPVSMGNYYRNFGIFVEPGIHATLISFAFLDELFHRKANLKILMLYIITTITTISTGGILSISLIMIIYVLCKNPSIYLKENSKLKKQILLTFLFGIIIFIFLFQSGYITTYIFEKLSSKDTISGHERRRGFLIVFEEFLNNPILGMGIEKAIGTYYVKQNTTMTVTILNWFGVYGIVYGIICLYGLLQYEIRNTHYNIMPKILFCIVIFAVTFSQDFSREFFVFIMIFYGYQNIKIKNLKGKNLWMTFQKNT